MRGITTILDGLTDRQKRDLESKTCKMVLNKNTERMYYYYFGVIDGYLEALMSVGALDGMAEAEMIRTYYVNKAEEGLR